MGREALTVARRAAVVAGWGGVAALVVAARVPLCPTAALLHLPCPGCGMTRAGVALLHGDLAGALALHPLSVVAVPLVGGLVAWNAAAYVRSGTAPGLTALHARWVTLATAALGAALIAVWIARFFGAFGGPVPV